jgi:hypothetical protein
MSAAGANKTVPRLPPALSTQALHWDRGRLARNERRRREQDLPRLPPALSTQALHWDRGRLARNERRRREQVFLQEVQTYGERINLPEEQTHEYYLFK